VADPGFHHVRRGKNAKMKSKKKKKRSSAQKFEIWGKNYKKV